MAKKRVTFQLNPETIAKVNFSREWNHENCTDCFPDMNAFQTELDELADYGFSKMVGGVVGAWDELTDEERKQYFK